MTSHLNAWKWIDFATIFISIWIILSIWAGYAGLLSPIIGIFSAALAVLVNRRVKIAAHEPSPKLSLIVWGVIVFVMGIIFFGIQGGYDLSADAAPSIATVIVGTSIPLTYTPYFDLPVFYQMGVPAAASQLSFLGISPHAVLWFLSMVGIGLLLLGLLRTGHFLNPNPLFLFWIPLVFVGTRLPFYNVFLGEYPWMVSAGLGMMAIALFSRSWGVGTLVLTASVLAHPYIGIISGLAWVALHPFDVQKIIRTAAAGFFLSLPLILFLILPFATLEHAPLSSVEPFSVQNFLASILLVGALPCVLAAGLFIQKIAIKESFSRNEIVILLLASGALIGSVFLNAWFPEFILGTKLPALVLIAAVLAGAQFLSKIVKPANIPHIAGLLILLSAAFLVTSPSMMKYAAGSKSSLDEAQFATFLRAYDSQVVPVLFLSEGTGKMAQYSQKIPSDPRGNHFMLSLQLLDSPAARALKQQSDAHRALFETKCVSCVDEFLSNYPMKYIVVNTDDFPRLEKNSLYESGNFILYDAT